MQRIAIFGEIKAKRCRAATFTMIVTPVEGFAKRPYAMR